MAGRPPGVQNKDKPFRDALRMEAASSANGEDCAAPPGSLRWIARALLLRAGVETAAAKEVADRLDGKVPQAMQHSGADGGPIEHRDMSARDIIDRRIASLVTRGGAESSAAKPH